VGVLKTAHKEPEIPRVWHIFSCILSLCFTSYIVFLAFYNDAYSSTWVKTWFSSKGLC
jgi:hypothetical protein